MNGTARDSEETLDLVRRAGAGDREVFGELLTRYKDRLQIMVELRLDRRLRGRVDASDVGDRCRVDRPYGIPGAGRVEDPLDFEVPHVVDAEARLAAVVVRAEGVVAGHGPVVRGAVFLRHGISEYLCLERGADRDRRRAKYEEGDADGASFRRCR